MNEIFSCITSGFEIKHEPENPKLVRELERNTEAHISGVNFNEKTEIEKKQ